MERQQQLPLKCSKSDRWLSYACRLIGHSTAIQHAGTKQPAAEVLAMCAVIGNCDSRLLLSCTTATLPAAH